MWYGYGFSEDFWQLTKGTPGDINKLNEPGWYAISIYCIIKVEEQESLRIWYSVMCNTDIYQMSH